MYHKLLFLDLVTFEANEVGARRELIFYCFQKFLRRTFFKSADSLLGFHFGSPLNSLNTYQKCDCQYFRRVFKSKRCHSSSI